ncbi:hypothetical protein O9H85_30560 [Paenibacillus filicis]|uniref:Uncharacterized protein n=1 Tax=Paenibacillus gyeongsangnamensis TaxID=3388067 RepID=A0ABT4QIX1_9BACL|nr:hypothetical protein [Paenibacillus filicis]MCZ8516651.1 hypothetical protein [Paenibacillus filicis]
MSDISQDQLEKILKQFETSELRKALNLIPPYSIARAIAFAINEPDDTLVSEILVRPTALH